MEKPTIYSLARELQVSPSTISRAFSQPGKVSTALRDRILKAAQAAGYQPNAAARALATGRTGFIGVLLPDITNPFFPQVVGGLVKAARRRGVEVLSIDSAEASESEQSLVLRVCSQVDGLILASPRSDAGGLVTAAGDTPAVCINRTRPGVSSTYIDDDDAIFAAMRHLRTLGHERIAVVEGPVQSWTAQRRALAAVDAARNLNLELAVLGSFPATFDGGLQAAPAIARSGSTAALAFDDASAFGVISGLATMGLRVPGDISVIGCDDVPFSSMTTPQLTSITAPVLELGEVAVNLLWDRMHGGSELSVVPLRSSLTVRGTTGGVNVDLIPPRQIS